MHVMSMPRFFAEQLSPGRVALPEREARHALASKRLVVGQEVALFDGQGTQALGRIISADRYTIEADILEVTHRERSHPMLTLATALPKGPRQDVLIEKCTELGVCAIQPLVTERSIASASAHRLNKWRQTTIEAAKQSNQCWLPELCAPQPLTAVLADLSPFDLKLLTVTCEWPTGEAFGEINLRSARRIIALVGPEGGWAGEEVEAIVEAGAKSVTLGPNVLRVETAAVALCAAVHGAMRHA